jgi:uncharacterized membrane protein
MMETPKTKTTLGIDENIEALLSYVLGWVSGVILLALERDNPFVRFHAAQSLAVFLPLFVMIIIIGALPFVGWALSWMISIFTLLLWLFLMFKAFKGEKYKLPIVGDFAEKQSSL